MAYIGKGPEQVLSGVASKSTFTGDGSTTTFDISTDIPAGGENDIQVFVDNVRQEPGSGASYTVGVDGSGNLRRITFNVAPEASQSIYVINPRRIEAVGAVPDNTIATAKVQDSAVSTAKIAADAITEAKIADDAISEEHLDVTALTDHTELSTSAADDDVLLVYDTSAGTLKKIQKSNVSLAVPTFSSVSPTSLTTGDLTGNYTIVVTGTKFDANATFKLRTSVGADISMDSVSRDSSTQLTGTVAKNTANLTNANEPFDIIIQNGSGTQVVATDQINVDAQPVYVTAAGSLGSGSGGTSVSFSVNATDPESAGNVTFELQSGTLPAGLSLTNTAAEGGTAIISGTATNPTANTTYNFTLRAVDAASNTSSRAFSITINRTFTSQSFTSSGTFSVPSGLTSISEVLVVAGGGGGGSANPGGGSRRSGGGGAGGLIYMPEYPVSPGGTITVTVGCGGAGRTDKSGGNGTCGQDSAFGSPGDPGFSPTSEVLTAKGGGGGSGAAGQPSLPSPSPGGSGGGGSVSTAIPVSSSGGSASQPTQPGNSGAYGFGNAGGAGRHGQGGGAGGGGGAGASGDCGSNTDPYAPGNGGRGGIGKAYTIADGTTSVYYAGGGGGNQVSSNMGGQGGQGGGGYASHSDANPLYPGNPEDAGSGEANKGGGGGGESEPATSQSAPGGKGVVIVRY